MGAGLRIGEILGLQWKDVQFERGTVEIRRQLTATLRLEAPKTGRSRRRVHLPAFALAALLRHRARLGVTPHPERLLFTDALGAPCAVRTSSGATGSRSFESRACRTFASTTSGTRRPRSCSPQVSTPRSFKTGSATLRSR